MVKAILDDDLTNIQKEVFGEAKKIAERLLNEYENLSLNTINNLIKKHNGLDQPVVLSFFGKIISTFFCKGIISMHNVANQAHDNEITARLIFDEMIEGVYALMSFEKENKQNYKNSNIKKIKA